MYSSLNSNYLNCLEREIGVTPLGLAIKRSYLESIHVLITYYASNTSDFSLSLKQLFSICSLIGSNSYLVEQQLNVSEVKLGIFRVIFDKLNAKLSQINLNNLSNESLFSICCGYGYENYDCYFNYLINLLNKQETNQVFVQKILSDTLIAKMRHSFELNINLVEKLLNYIEDKRALYEKLVEFESSFLLRPNENNLKNYELSPPLNKGFCKLVKNSYLIKQQLLIKYDIVPVEDRLKWLASFVYCWANVWTNRAGAYVSAATIVRFINVDELIDMVASYYEYLVRFGFVNGSMEASSWFDLNKLKCLNGELKSRIEGKLVPVFSRSKQAKSPVSLIMIARNILMFLMPYLSNYCLLKLDILKYLVDYLVNNTN